jgi:predicted Rossmann-fold nucleotide-binding protein
MRVIVAGGRHHKLIHKDFQILNNLKDSLPITVLVSGGCRGVDTDVEQWAAYNGLEVHRFPVSRQQWQELGPAAGPMRNRDMAAHADACILFPGGPGTRSMHAEAKKANLIIFVIDSAVNKR